jgi:hypothetical protein
VCSSDARPAGLSGWKTNRQCPTSLRGVWTTDGSGDGLRAVSAREMPEGNQAFGLVLEPPEDRLLVPKRRIAKNSPVNDNTPLAHSRLDPPRV